jgi:hypothetical protein
MSLINCVIMSVFKNEQNSRVRYATLEKRVLKTVLFNSRDLGYMTRPRIRFAQRIGDKHTLIDRTSSVYEIVSSA